MPASSAAWSRGAVDADDVSADRYARGGELGRGGMGIVEAAVDRWLDRDVAVKRPRGESDLARLTREARITARLVHPSIPPVYDVGEDDHGPFYTMPVLVGSTLRDRVAAGEATRTLVAAVATACRAVGYAHARGVVHRDLKPANVLLGAHGEVWVLDWGLALDPAHPDASAVGTPGFRAPEATAGRVVTPAADVYGLGETLRVVLDATPRPLPELSAVVERATRADPSQRYPDGAAMAEDLDRWLDGRLVQAHAYPAREILWHLAARWRAPLSVAAVAAAIGLVLGASAIRAQRAERSRADRSLSVSLAQQAAALRDARPEAEVLAAHSLALAENPLARGVLMAWAAAPPLALRSVGPTPCERPFVEPDGHVVCEGETLRVIDPRGRERWSAPFPPLLASDGTWVGEVVEARRYDDDTVVIRRSSNVVEVWRDGSRAHVLEGHQGFLGLADGPVPALIDQRRVGRLDPRTGAVSWGPETCAQIEAAWVRDDGVLVACRAAEVFVGPFDDPGPPVALPGHPSALAWQRGPVIGTFDGLLIALDPGEPSGFSAVDTGDAGVRQVLPLGAGRVGVVGERGEVGVWSAHDGVALGAVPRGASAVASDGGDLLAFGATVRRHALPEGLRPVRFDRAAQGGIAAFDVSPSGARLVAGSASGEIASWAVATGAVRREVPPGDATAKGVRFVGEESFVHALRDEGLLRRRIGGATPTPLTHVFAREVQPHAGGLALLPWSAGVVLLGDGERFASLPARPLAATVAGALWVADEGGGVHVLEGSGFARRFDLPRPTPVLAASGDRLLVADGSAVEARRPDGAVVWRFEGTAPVTALEATRDWIAVGDLEGGVRVLHPDGALLAGLTGHARRVSGLVLRGDVLYSGGWDGVVRAWGLRGLDVEPAALVASVTARWGLTLDEALAGAEPLGPGR